MIAYFWTLENIGNRICLVSWDPGNTGVVSLQHSPESWKYYPIPKPNPKSLFLINIYPCSAPDRLEATQVGTPPLFLCAGAVLESPRLAKGSPVDAKTPMLSRDAPKTSQWRPRCPKVCPKTAQGAPMRPQRSPKERQKELNAVPRACLGTPMCVQRSPRYFKTPDQLHQRPLC